MRTIVLLLTLTLLTACTSPDPLGFVARAERDVEIARINADNQIIMIVFVAGLLLAGVIIILSAIRADERVRIAQAKAEAQRRLPPPVLGRYTLAAPDDDDEWLDVEEGKWRKVPRRQIARMSTGLAKLL